MNISITIRRMFDPISPRLQVDVCPLTPLSSLDIPVLIFKEKFLDTSATFFDYGIRDGDWLLESVQTQCSF